MAMRDLLHLLVGQERVDTGTGSGVASIAPDVHYIHCGELIRQIREKLCCAVCHYTGLGISILQVEHILP